MFDKNTYRIMQVLEKEAELNGDKDVLEKSVQEKEKIKHKIEQLEAIDKEVYACMLLRYIYGYSVSKVAYRSHMSEATVKRRIAKGEKLINS